MKAGKDGKSYKIVASEYIEKQRYYLIRKSNTLSLDTRTTFTLQEQKLLGLFMSKIRPFDTDFYNITMPIREICEVFGIECVGKNYANLKDSLQGLADKSAWLYKGEQEIFLFRFFKTVTIDTEAQTVTVRFSDFMKPLLLLISEKYTEYPLIEILDMRHEYSAKISDMCQALAYKGGFTIDLDELRNKIGIEPNQYTTYSDFRKFILEPAITDTNNNTKINVTVTPQRVNRKIKALYFEIAKKSTIDTILTHSRIEENLNKPKGSESND